MPKETLTLTRRGDVIFHTGGSNHCGLSSLQALRYEIAATCETALDHRGFLFEQRNIDALMQKMAGEMVTASCERLAMSISGAVRFRAGHCDRGVGQRHQQPRH